jgi:hypothetical protein
MNRSDGAEMLVPSGLAAISFIPKAVPGWSETALGRKWLEDFLNFFPEAASNSTSWSVQGHLEADG